MPCDGGNVGRQEQENVIEEGKTCYLEGQDVCNLIWNRVDQGVKTWTEAKAVQSSLRVSVPIQSTTSTASVPCASRESGNVNRERRITEEPWSVRLGQSDSREYGTEIFELEEQIQNLAIKEEKSMHALYDELLKVSSKEGVDLLRQTLGQDIPDAHEHTEGWGKLS